MSTYSTRYQYSFLQAYPTYIGEVCPRWRVSFNYKDYTGPIQQLLPGYDPLIIQSVDSDEDRLSGVWPLKFTFSLTCSGEWKPETLAVTSDREVLVVIDLDITGTGNSYANEFFGWVVPVDFKIEYGPFPYLVSVTASDGLASLKDLPITSADATPLFGKITLSVALRSALNRAGYRLPLATSIGLLEVSDRAEGVLPNGNQDPLYQTDVKAEAFLQGNGEIQYALDAIKRLLNPFTARLSQAKGAWWVVRADDAGGGNNPHNSLARMIRVHPYSGVEPSASPENGYDTTLVKNIGIGGQGRVRAGSPVNILPQIVKGIRVDQDYGRNINRLPNGDWSNVDSTGLPVGWVRQNMNPGNSYRAGTGTDIDPYYMVIQGATDEKFGPVMPSIFTTITYDPSTLEYQSSYERTLKGQFELFNLNAAKIVVIASRLGHSYILQNSGSWLKDPSGKEQNGILIYHSQPAGQTRIATPGKADIDIKMEALDKISTLRIFVCVGEAITKANGQPNLGPPVTYVKYYGLRLETGQANQNITGTASRIAPKKVKVETVATLTLGDVPNLGDMAYYKTGALFRRVTGMATQKWVFSNSNSLASGQELRDIVAQSYARDQMTPAPSFEGEIMARFPHAMHTVLRLLDFGEIVNGVFTPYLLQLTRWKFSARFATNSVTAVRIPQRPATVPAIDYFWKTPDGDIPLNLDEEGLPANPAIDPTKGSVLDKTIQKLTGSGRLLPEITVDDLAGYTAVNGGTNTLKVIDTQSGRVLARVPSAFRKQLDLFATP